MRKSVFFFCLCSWLFSACSDNSAAPNKGGSSGNMSDGGTDGDSGMGSDHTEGHQSPLTRCFGNTEPKQTCTGVNEYDTCVVDTCGSEYEKCLGPNFRNGHFSGVCGDYFKCTVSCDCADSNCVSTCQDSYNEECISCIETAERCVATSECVDPICRSEKIEVTGSCGELQDCCDELPEAAVSLCGAIVSSEIDDACSISLKSYQDSELCD